jgi:hypothetical protein
VARIRPLHEGQQCRRPRSNSIHNCLSTHSGTVLKALRISALTVTTLGCAAAPARLERVRHILGAATHVCAKLQRGQGLAQTRL